MSEYDVCVYCAAKGCADNSPQHARNCPIVTGVYPVDLGLVGARCNHCGDHFRLGEHYTHLKVTDDINENVCLGCAAIKGAA